MQNKSIRIVVLFVEPMLYGMDLIHEVYEKTEYEFKYIYCYQGLTGKDGLRLPENSYLNNGNKKERRRNVLREIEKFEPDFVVVNGYVGLEQTVTIRYCQKHKIPYAIESDTPLHIPENAIKAYLKKKYLSKMLGNEYCYGFPGGTLQKENLTYYGIPEERCFVMPMSVSEKRLMDVSGQLPDKSELKKKYGLENKKVFLFVGRLEQEKNVSLLLSAYSELKTMRDDVALVIVGDGTEIYNLKSCVVENDIRDVYFMGYVVFPKIVEFYKLSDIFVLPSLYEPWGLVINEAMIFGVPIVASSKVGCLQDLLQDGMNGYVFVNDNVDDLVDKLNLSLKLGPIYTKSTDVWNYNKYLNNFELAVRDIC